MSSKLGTRSASESVQIFEDEAELLEALRQGEESAYEALVRSQTPRMLAVARRLLRGDDAQDAVQEAFVSAFRSIDRFVGESRLSTWLHRIVVNACLMRLRSRHRRPEQSIDEFLPSFFEDGRSCEPAVSWDHRSGDDGLDLDELRVQVRHCIDQLPETYRTVLLLRDIEELDTNEVAEMLGITGNAVKIRLHRARQALRTLLDPYMRQASETACASSVDAAPLALAGSCLHLVASRITDSSRRSSGLESARAPRSARITRLREARRPQQIPMTLQA